MEDLEVVVRRLQEEKAAMESENQALKRQNEYFQGLFANQQKTQINISAASISLPAQMAVPTRAESLPTTAP